MSYVPRAAGAVGVRPDLPLVLGASPGSGQVRPRGSSGKRGSTASSTFAVRASFGSLRGARIRLPSMLLAW
jgi:hypothetical protein